MKRRPQALLERYLGGAFHAGAVGEAIAPFLEFDLIAEMRGRSGPARELE